MPPRRSPDIAVHWIMISRELFALLLLVPVLNAQNPTTMFPQVRASHEMAAAGNQMEVEAGFRILQHGGNAVDAGVATVLTAAVTEQDHFGLGGEMPLIIKMANQPPVVISGVGPAPAKATVAFYNSRKPEPWEMDGKPMPPIPAQGILAATVPGVFDGLILALQKYGTMSFADVVEPALERAEGFPLTDIWVQYLQTTEKLLRLWPTSVDFFFPNKGAMPQRGDIWKATNLVGTLRELMTVEKQARGNRQAKLTAVRDYFYKGSIAKRIGEFSETHGGLLTYNDLAAYHAEIDTPRTTTYRGYEIVKPGFWTQGPVMLEALNMLEGYDLKAMGHNSPEYLHTVVEAAKLAFADRDRFYGDPKFSKIPEDTLLSKSYAENRRKLIDPAQASLESRPGDFAPPIPMGNTTTPSVGVQDTTCANVVDHWGNVFSATPSGAWLPSVIAGDTGIPLGTRLQTLVTVSGHPNELQPGKRPRVTLSPTMILKDGKVFAALSTPGGDNQDQALLQVVLNLIDFEMPAQQALEAPRFQTEHFYASFAMHEFIPGKLNLEGRIPRATAERLTALGHKVNVAGEWSNGSAPTLIKILPNGVLEGGADPRRSRFVFGN